ncbi:MAG: DR2241 family protein [Chthoniobacterales bacterium]
MRDWLDDLPCRIGQVFAARDSDERVVLCHRDDVNRNDLLDQNEAEAALEIARFDDEGSYRPLKTAPTLRHGWRLLLDGIGEAQRALEYFYPGRAAAFRAWRAGTLLTTPLRETLNRQTGMYRVAARISDARADEVVANFCRSDGGCLRTILWQRKAGVLPPTKFDPEFDQYGRGEEARPLLCQEACNLLVAEMRKAVKDSPNE